MISFASSFSLADSVEIFFSSLVETLGVSSFAFRIVSFIKLQYRSIDLRASSLPGIGKSIPSGSELVSNIPKNNNGAATF